MNGEDHAFAAVSPAVEPSFIVVEDSRSGSKAVIGMAADITMTPC
jgi:hypothetical protein